jgi:hypothetical protein
MAEYPKQADIIVAPVLHSKLFQDGFPYTHKWIEGQQSGSQLLIAKSKPAEFKKDLKRVLDDDSTDTSSKKARVESDDEE